MIGNHQMVEPGQATVEFALTLPFLFLFTMCVVQIGSVANNQLVLNQAAQSAARAISLADVTSDSAHKVATDTIDQETNLQNVSVVATLGSENAKVDLKYEQSLSIPVISAFFGDIELCSSAVVARQMTNEN